MTARVSIGTHQGDVFRRFIAPTMDVDDGDGGGGHGPHHQAPIHSGHFMVSCVHDDATAPGDDDDGEEDEDAVPANDEGDEGKRGDELGYDFENASRVPLDSYKFGVRSTNQLSIDASLARLFNHMTLAYSGKITSPKWKNFKGIKVKLKDKIRLNNIIWREWHMQYIKRQKPIVCQFEAPISERTHSKPEAVVLEGKYWKRRLQCLTTEYKKWRLFYKNRNNKVQKEPQSMEEGDLISLLGDYERIANQYPPIKLFDEQIAIDDDYLSTFVNDTLFSSLNPPFAFPDAREIAQYGFGDIIQPNLIQLQPRLDESMDTLAPLPALNEFRDFRRSPTEKNCSRKITDSGLIAVLFGDAPFSEENLPPETLNSKLQSAMIPKEEDLLSQLQEQLMSTSTLSPDSCLDLFMTENSVMPMTATASSVVMTSRDDPLFSGLCDEQRGIPKALGRRASDQPLQRNSNTAALDLGRLCGVEGQQMMLPCDFVATASNVPAFPGGLESALFQPVYVGSNQLQTVALVPGCNPSHGQAVVSMVSQIPWAQAHSQPPSCTPTNSLGSRLNQSDLTNPVASQQCLQNSVSDKTCRRGSTGSLQPSKGSSGSLQPARGSAGFIQPARGSAGSLQQPARGSVGSLQPAKGSAGSLQQPARGSAGSLQQPAKGSADSLQPSKGRKHVTFLCPQPVESWLTSKPKQRHLAPAPTFCESSTSKAPDGVANVSTGNAVPCAEHKQQNKTILARLLTQGNTVVGPFLPQKSATKSNQSTSRTVASNDVQSTNSSQNTPVFPVAVAGHIATNTHKVPVPPCQAASQPSSFSEFHKSMLSAAISQALGFEMQDAREVTSSLFNNAMPGVVSNASSPTVPAATTSQGMVRACLPNNNESTESINDEDLQLSENPHENRRVHHLSAEQKRRSNIKNGFEMLNQLVPELSAISSGKVNKATTLQKAAECCRRLKSERQTKVSEMEALRRQIDELQSEISSCQSKLPATGVPVVRPQMNLSKALFQDYVRNRTLANWKFWIFSFLIRPLFEAYDESVVVTSTESFCQSVLTWLQQHCSLIALRPAVLKVLRELSTTTSILVDPSNMPNEATEAVSRGCGSPVQPSFTH